MQVIEEKVLDLPRARARIPLKRRLAYAAIIYLNFLLLLAAIELGTRLTMSHLSSLELFVVTTQQKAQVADEKHSGIFEGDPLLLWRLKPNLDHVVWDFTVLSTNSDHLRSEQSSRSLKARLPGTFRIVCLGDSVTFGYRVPAVWPEKPNEYDREWLPYPMLLEKHLRQVNPDHRVDVINMAVPGYTSHQGLAWLRRDIDYLDPNLLIVSFGWNDVSMSDIPDRETIRTDWFPVVVRWVIDHSQAFAHATNWLRTRSKPHQGPVRPVPRVSDAEYVANFLSIIDLARAHKAGVMVIAAPYRDRVTNPPEAELMTRYRSALRSSMQDHQVPYLEILELTEAAASVNKGWFGELIHPNHMGHRLMTSEILEMLAKKAMVKDLTVKGFTP